MSGAWLPFLCIRRSHIRTGWTTLGRPCKIVKSSLNSVLLTAWHRDIEEHDRQAALDR